MAIAIEPWLLQVTANSTAGEFLEEATGEGCGQTFWPEA